LFVLMMDEITSVLHTGARRLSLYLGFRQYNGSGIVWQNNTYSYCTNNNTRQHTTIFHRRRFRFRLWTTVYLFSFGQLQYHAHPSAVNILRSDRFATLWGGATDAEI